MRWATSCALCVLVVLAGCNGLAGGGDSDQEVTVTPAPIPETGPQFPPGVTAEGVTDPTVLASAHRSQLEETSFTKWINRTVRYPNGTVYQQSNRTIHIAADDRLRGRTERDRRRSLIEPPWWTRWELWIGQERRMTAATYLNGTMVYQKRSGERGISRESVTRIDGMWLGESPFEEGETRIVGNTTRNGITHYRIEIAEPAALPLVPLEESVRKANDTLQAASNGTAIIDTTGVIRMVRLRFPLATADGQRVSVVHTIRFTDIGSTTVERPPWYSEAVKAIDAANGSAS